ncbi:MAG TPA: hypothetical protein DCZ80_05805 [Legionellales bacterium]|nr:hypothetical protein [Legionellales bacterium]
MNVSKLIVGLVVAGFSVASFAAPAVSVDKKEAAAVHHMKKNHDQRMGRRDSRHHKEAAMWKKNQGSVIDSKKSQ